MFYFTKTPSFLKRLTPNLLWSVAVKEKVIFLTFDDGPTPNITNWVLQQLDAYNAKATFFCIGKNIQENPQVLSAILKKGHAVGNHTHNHKNAWKTATKDYLNNVDEAQQTLETHQPNPSAKLFRPPYGKITPTLSKQLKKEGYTTVMWDVLSADFDTSISTEKCWDIVRQKTEAGSIIVFHDSVKAFPHLQKVLPKTLEHFTTLGYTFKALPYAKP